MTKTTRAVIFASLVGVALVSGAASCGSSGSSSSAAPGNSGGAAGAVGAGAGGTGTAGTGGAATAGGGGAAGFTPCVGAQCPAAREVCKIALPLCVLTSMLYETDPVGALEGCAGAIVEGSEKSAAAFGKTADALQKQWIDCLKTATTCEAVKLCQPGAVKPCSGDGCHEEGDGGLVPIPDAGTQPARVGLPGDLPECINCAVKNCAAVADTCFPDTQACKPSKVNPSDPEGDCCYRFRACMNECELAFPPAQDEATYTDCVTNDCNVTFPQGRTEFVAFGDCMSMKCANCGSAP